MSRLRVGDRVTLNELFYTQQLRDNPGAVRFRGRVGTLTHRGERTSEVEGLSSTCEHWSTRYLKKVGYGVDLDVIL